MHRRKANGGDPSESPPLAVLFQGYREAALEATQKA
jgi:hypothetical protein